MGGYDGCGRTVGMVVWTDCTGLYLIGKTLDPVGWGWMAPGRHRFVRFDSWKPRSASLGLERFPWWAGVLVYGLLPCDYLQL